MNKILSDKSRQNNRKSSTNKLIAVKFAPTSSAQKLKGGESPTKCGPPTGWKMFDPLAGP